MTYLARIAAGKRPRQASTTANQPAPVGGWNARDPLADMPEQDAVLLDNWFSERSRVRVRNGYKEHATGMTGPIESLMAWTGGASAKLFAAVGGDIFQVTAAGAVGAADLTGLANARWQHVNFETAGGHFLYIVNGANAERYYDGTVWTSPTITHANYTAGDFINVHEFKERLFFIKKNTLDVFYFPVVTIAGAISRFPMGQIFELGGRLVAMGSWTLDAGDGLDDYAVFITSKGEVAIYKGNNPGDANNWTLVGVFRIGAPIGNRPFLQIGSSMIIITEDGFTSLADSLKSARSSESANISDKIREVTNEAVRLHRDKFGWEGILFSAGNKVIFNVPIVENEETHQYVFNSTTGAPARFTGWNAFCFELFNDKLYFGAKDKVMEGDVTRSDNGQNIRAVAISAFKYFGSKSALKQFHQVRPVLGVSGDVTPSLGVATDWSLQTDLGTTATFAPAVGALWDIALWDVSSWSAELVILKNWQGTTALGYSAALRIEVVMNEQEVEWYSTDWIYEEGAFY